MSRKISVIGRGMDPARHLTMAGLRALRAADRVIGIEPEIEAWQELRQEFGLPEIEDVSHLYRSDARDKENYDRFTQYVLEESKQHERLALLVAGHPRLGVSFLQKLPGRLPESTKLEVIEGISSFDVLLNDLGTDPIERGTSLLDVNRLLLFRYELEPSVAYYLYHVCSVANSITNYSAPEHNTRLTLLTDYLLRFYPADKEIFLCRASNGERDPSSRISLRLRDLAAAAPQISFSTTLYLPPDLPKRIDREFLQLL